MKIYHKDGFVDFEAPFYMRDQQVEKFIKCIESIFGDRMVVERIIENKKEMGDIVRHPKKFSDEDLLILGNPELDNEEVSIKMDKSPFAIQMKRGNFLMRVQDWAIKKGKDRVTEEDIKEFLKEEGKL